VKIESRGSCASSNREGGGMRVASGESCAPLSKREGGVKVASGESRESPNWRGRRVGRGIGIKIFYFV